jgi:hypothetical protein
MEKTEVPVIRPSLLKDRELTPKPFLAIGVAHPSAVRKRKYEPPIIPEYFPRHRICNRPKLPSYAIGHNALEPPIDRAPSKVRIKTTTQQELNLTALRAPLVSFVD